MRMVGSMKEDRYRNEMAYAVVSKAFQWCLLPKMPQSVSKKKNVRMGRVG